MKMLFKIGIAVLFISAVLFFIKPDSKEILLQPSKLEEKSRPAEHFHFMRSYPDKEFSAEGYNQALAEAINFKEAQELSRNNRSLQANWNLEGPTNVGGRFNALAVHPNNNNVIFAGSAAGGVFKTTNGGTTWSPITENLSYLSISDITLDPSHPDTIYLATGDHNISGIPHPGDGVYKSTDGGITWSQSGLSSSRIISKIVIDPSNTSIIYAAAMGNPFAPDTNRGVYKSTDGGATWSQSLFLSTETGAIDILMDPFNSGTLYCTGWDRIRTNQRSLVSGNGGRIWKSTDSGATWNLAHTGIPFTRLSRIGITHSGITPNLLFASVIDSTQNLEGCYKSTNGGANWTKIPINGVANTNDIFRSFGWYFGQIRVNPFNDNEISLLGVDMYSTFDGGLNWSMSTPVWSLYQVHADKHDMIHLNATTTLLATDGGLYKSTNTLNTWTDIETTPTTQFYRVTVNPLSSASNKEYTGGAQDNGTLTGNQTNLNSWIREFGGDGFKAYFDDTNFVNYYETQNGNIYSFDGSSYLLLTNGFAADDRKNWDMPYLMSHYKNSTLYCGTEKMYRMTGAPYLQWDSISPDLTDGNIFGRSFHTISTIDESQIDRDYLYAGTTDGNVWYTNNGGTTWNDITTGLPNRYVTSVNASLTNKNEIYVAHSGYKYNELIPHIHKSNNNGGSWNDISGNLPNVGINDICLYEGFDSVIFVATDDGVYTTTDEGGTWNRVGGNMPIVPVFDLEIDYENKKLIAGTFARSMMSFELDSVIMKAPNNTSLAENSKNDFLLFPNPASNYTTISGGEIDKTYSVFDSKGALIISGKINTKNQVIDVTHLRNGLYFVTLGRRSVRFIKQ